MTFQPVVPLSGYAGWAFLSRTRETQQETLNNTPLLSRETSHFRENIASVQTAGDLVKDRSLLKVALGAFGLEADIDNRFFIQKVLEGDTLDTASLPNRLSDKRYLAFSKAFGFGDFAIPRTQLSEFAGEITMAYEAQSFEVAVGVQNENLRLALGIEREISNITSRDVSDTTMWFTMMGNAPVRKVFETALGLPTSFSSLDLDRQLEVFRERADRTFGETTLAQFEDPEKQERLVRLFLFRSELQSQPASLMGSQAALTLLQSSTFQRL